MLLKLQPATQTDEPWMHASQLAHHWLAAIATLSGSEEEKRHVGHMLICHNVRDDPKQPKRSMGSSDVTRVLSSAIKQAGQYGNTLCFDLSSHPRQQANRLAPERLNQRSHRYHGLTLAVSTVCSDLMAMSLANLSPMIASPHLES
jgi:hypothetical protein